MSDIIERLTLDYGDTCFQCGQYRGNNASAYINLSDKREAAHNALVAEITLLREDNKKLSDKAETLRKELEKFVDSATKSQSTLEFSTMCDKHIESARAVIAATTESETKEKQ